MPSLITHREPLRRTRTGTPMRQFKDYLPGDTFRYKGRTYLKLESEQACDSDPNAVCATEFRSTQWLCEY